MIPENLKMNGVKLRFWQINPETGPMMGSWAIDSLIIDSPLNISSLMPQDMSPGSQLPMYNDIHTEWTRQTQTNKPLQWDKISKLENTFGQRLWWRTVNTNISTSLG